MTNIDLSVLPEKLYLVYAFKDKGQIKILVRQPEEVKTIVPLNSIASFIISVKNDQILMRLERYGNLNKPYLSFEDSHDIKEIHDLFVRHLKKGFLKKQITRIFNKYFKNEKK